MVCSSRLTPGVLYAHQRGNAHDHATRINMGSVLVCHVIQAIFQESGQCICGC